MKKLIASVVLAASPFTAFALGGHGPAGCGLGTEVVFKNADEWHEHVLAATTNATSGNQTFGMTSGTLGCESANGPLADASIFIDANMEQLAADFAAGQGETLDALAEVIGIAEQERTHFNAVVQRQFDSLFSSTATNSQMVYQNLVAIMESDSLLSKYLA